MCGRYQLDDDMKAIIERFDIESVFEDPKRKIGEIFPTDRVPVVTSSGSGNELRILRWGIRPVFMNNDIINTRRESLFTKRMFNNAVISGRCIIPANYFYEWEKTDDKKIKRKLGAEGINIIAFAGIVMASSDPKTKEGIQAFSIITKEASQSVMSIHNRMPVILKPEDEKHWLDKKTRRDDIEDIIERSLRELRIA